MTKLFKTAALATVALSLLAGCGSPLATGLHAKGTAKIRAKGLSFDDVIAVVGSRVQPALPVVSGGMPAVMAAPTDVLAQRGVGTLYATVVEKTLPELDPVLDESMRDAIKQEIPASQINTNPEANTYLQGIADRLSKASGAPGFKVYLLDVDDWNAFNAGGNSMYVFTGLVKGVKDEAELAGVMAHEMTHGVRRHALQGIVGSLAQAEAKSWVSRKYLASQDDKELTDALLLTLTPAQRRDKDFVIGYLQGKVSREQLTNVQFGLNSSFANRAMGRRMEAEADAVGARMLAAASYDPYAMADAFDALNKYPDGDLRYYDHPALGARVASVRYQVDAEGLARQGQERAPERLKAIVDKLNAAPGRTPGQLPVRARQFLCK